LGRLVSIEMLLSAADAIERLQDLPVLRCPTRT